MWIQPILDWKYLEEKSCNNTHESSLCTEYADLLFSEQWSITTIYIVLSVVDNLKMILNILDSMHDHVQNLLHGMLGQED